MVDILVAVAQMVPVPALSAAVKVAAGIIKACDVRIMCFSVLLGFI